MASQKFYSDITKSIHVINKHLKHLDDKISSQAQFNIAHIVSLLVIKSSQLLADLNFQRKNELRWVIILVLQRLYIEIIQSLPREKRKHFTSYLESIIRESTFIFNIKYLHYRYIYRLNKFWSIIEANKVAPDRIVNRVVGSRSNTRLIWNGRISGSFDKFLIMISELGISTPENFRLLFEPQKPNLKIELNTVDPSFVLQFLCCLKESKLVSYYNSKGFYQVFRTNVRDFDSTFLKNRLPQRRVDTVKKHVTWYFNKDRFDKSLKRLL